MEEINELGQIKEYKYSDKKNDIILDDFLNPSNESIKKKDKFKKISLKCPICKTQKEIRIPISIIQQSPQLTTVSIPQDLVCKHHFQAFVDKNFTVRGYQKVDLDLSDSNIRLTTDNEIDTIKINPPFKLAPEINEKKNNLEKIYQEFWKFIDDENYDFREFILKDKRRKARNHNESNFLK